jgi:hypothetical protein
MAISRYSSTPLVDFGTQYGTSDAIFRIRKGVKDGTLAYQEIIVKGKERLDTIAGEVYGDSRFWWILAASSNIGWGLQIPTGTVIKVVQLSEALSLVT